MAVACGNDTVRGRRGEREESILTEKQLRKNAECEAGEGRRKVEAPLMLGIGVE